LPGGRASIGISASRVVVRFIGDAAVIVPLPGAGIGLARSGTRGGAAEGSARFGEQRVAAQLVRRRQAAANSTARRRVVDLAVEEHVLANDDAQRDLVAA
jgi:hypothetical protein